MCLLSTCQISPLAPRVMPHIKIGFATTFHSYRNKTMDRSGKWASGNDYRIIGGHSNIPQKSHVGKIYFRRVPDVKSAHTNNWY